MLHHRSRQAGSGGLVAHSLVLSYTSLIFENNLWTLIGLAKQRTEREKRRGHRGADANYLPIRYQHTMPEWKECDGSCMSIHVLLY